MDVESTGEVCFVETMEDPGINQEPQEKRSSNATTPPTSATGCFDCNICLDFAVEPVVTLCGHLYCWPCIYKWLQQAESSSQQQCPVCKASLSRNTLVPLYGRGHSRKRSLQSLEQVPSRPASVHREPEPQTEHDTGLLTPTVQHRQQHYHLDGPNYGYPYSNHISPPPSPLMTPTGTRMIHSTAEGVLSGMAIAVLPWVYRNHEAVLVHSPGANHLAGGGLSTPTRSRLQEMQVERSLHQIWLFFFCCTLLCLFLF